jgi:hypothetical protein
MCEDKGEYLSGYDIAALISRARSKCSSRNRIQAKAACELIYKAVASS